jgi:hypothetical protein
MCEIRMIRTAPGTFALTRDGVAIEGARVEFKTGREPWCLVRPGFDVTTFAKLVELKRTLGGF